MPLSLVQTGLLRANIGTLAFFANNIRGFSPSTCIPMHPSKYAWLSDFNILDILNLGEAGAEKIKCKRPNPTPPSF